ncbi:MAG TPA: DUF2235 domain-containing protein [Chthoniobacterales bacterium]|jgi:uncharacterized protein (DUF2235 family)
MNSPPEMRQRQRLVVCLDGTWNKRDDSTNILHHFALAFKDTAPVDGIVQTKYYHAGVGTGVLDSVTGGAFGFGLEDNVRNAYDWLVEHYHDDPPNEPDQIFIFGFSRGAYTARSLVGFISTCGLVRRGAPLSVRELWEDACLIGREREKRRAIWDYIFGPAPKSIRRITALVADPWNIEKVERERAVQDLPNDPNRVPGQLRDDLTLAEQLLVRWSRRARITYLGVYDTVGALGLDALAIPGLKSKLALHHNVRPTTLIQHCRHALALDEHRSSFNHTPFLQFTGHGASVQAPGDAAVAAANAQNEASHWHREAAMWRRKIEQRWFVGAHSNIGGGYPDNQLVLHPFRWLLEGACSAGLRCEPFPDVPILGHPLPRDSYAEFVRPFWTQIIRGKRFYRTVDPEPRVRAKPPRTAAGVAPAEEEQTGFTLTSIHEDLDASVLNCARENADYRPPNLYEYATRKLQENPGASSAEDWRALAAQKPERIWLRNGADYLILLLWSVGAAFGLVALKDLFAPQVALRWLFGLGAAGAFGFALVDWMESRANFLLALGPTKPRRRAFLDTIYWARSLGFVLFSLGTISLFIELSLLGWRARDLLDTWQLGLSFMAAWWPVAALAGLGIIFANLLDRAPARRQWAGLVGALLGIATAALTCMVIVFSGWFVSRIVASSFGDTGASESQQADNAALAGLLLLLQLSCLCLMNTYRWIGDPMRRANLGTIVKLQFCFTPATVTRRLETWRQALACHWDDADKDAQNGLAARALRAILREALWRDIFGFIPSYVFVLGFGCWFAANVLDWKWLATPVFGAIPWLALPLIAMAADYYEDCCHLRYLILHQAGAGFSLLLTFTSGTATVIKFLFFGIAIPVTLISLWQGNWFILDWGNTTGWRGTLALLVSSGVALFVILVSLGAIVYRVRRRIAKSAT